MKAALCMVALAACVEPAPPIEPQVTSHTARMQFLPIASNKVDILFVIDSSQAIAPHRAHLDAKLPLLMDALGDLSRGLPDLHIGVITANDDGVMHPRGSMTGTYLSDAPQINGSRTRNYVGTLGEAFRAYADVGAASTAPSRPFAAVELALDPAANPGFARDEAYLAVIYVTATDDASGTEVAAHVARLKNQFADPTKVIVSAISGPRSGTTTCGAVAAPRLHALLDAFPNRSAMVSICDDDLRPAIALAGQLLKTLLGLACWELAPLDLDPVMPGAQRDCAAYLTTDANGVEDSIAIPECGTAPTEPCWRIIDEPKCSSFDRVALTTRLEPINLGLPTGTSGEIECVVAAPSAQNP